MLPLVFITTLRSRYKEHPCIPEATEALKDHMLKAKELQSSRGRVCTQVCCCLNTSSYRDLCKSQLIRWRGERRGRKALALMWVENKMRMRGRDACG